MSAWGIYRLETRGFPQYTGPAALLYVGCPGFPFPKRLRRHVLVGWKIRSEDREGRCRKALWFFTLRISILFQGRGPNMRKPALQGSADTDPDGGVSPQVGRLCLSILGSTEHAHPSEAFTSVPVKLPCPGCREHWPVRFLKTPGKAERRASPLNEPQMMGRQIARKE